MELSSGLGLEIPEHEGLESSWNYSLACFRHVPNERLEASWTEFLAWVQKCSKMKSGGFLGIVRCLSLEILQNERLEASWNYFLAWF